MGGWLRYDNGSFVRVLGVLHGVGAGVYTAAWVRSFLCNLFVFARAFFLHEFGEAFGCFLCVEFAYSPCGRRRVSQGKGYEGGNLEEGGARLALLRAC